MNVEEWIAAATAIKDLQVKMNAMLLLAATAALGEDANPCSTCGKLMVPYGVWQQIPQALKPEVFGGECSGQGLCASCAGRERAKNKTQRTGGPLSPEDLLRLRAAVGINPRRMQ
jgi:hypothetical protein